MARCTRCGKHGIFLRISSSGLCMECLEQATIAAADVVSKLHASKKDREELCAALDRQENDDKIKTIEASLESSPFSFWDISIHRAEGQYDRILRSKSVKIIRYDAESQRAEVAGSKTKTYTTTFSACTCGDFISRHLPCKHMYKLASQYGNVDLSRINN